MSFDWITNKEPFICPDCGEDMKCPKRRGIGEGDSYIRTQNVIVDGKPNYTNQFWIPIEKVDSAELYGICGSCKKHVTLFVQNGIITGGELRR